MALRVLLDTNVVLDLLLARDPFYLDALQIFAMAEAKKADLLLSTDAISTICYVIAKNRNGKTARQAITSLLDYVSLATLDERSVRDGLVLGFADIEDALVAAVAQNNDAQFIVTRNAKDFKNSPVPAITPREFVAAYQSNQSNSI